MNPFAFPRCARRTFTALAVITGIFLTVGCGSSSTPAPVNQQGFSDSNLSGTYVFLSEGADSTNGGPLTVAGAFVANGTSANNNITGGTMDVVDPFFTTPVLTNQTITSGTYNVNADGRGSVALTTTAGTLTFYFVLTTTSGGISSQGLLTEFDSTGSGSGTLDLQTAITSLTPGNYAFSLSGTDASTSLNPLATTGAFTLASSGNSGVLDLNDNGTYASVPSIDVSATLGSSSATAPGAMTLGEFGFDFYPIDASHFKLIETDGSQGFLGGDVFNQTTATLPTSVMAYTMAGVAGAGAVANGGFVTYTAASNSFNGVEDVNNNGTVPPTQGTFTGVAAPTTSAFGRTTITLTGFSPAVDLVVYPSSGGLLMLEADSSGVTVGAAYTQTSGSLATSQGYGFNLSGSNTSVDAVPYVENDNAQFNTTSTGITGVVDVNDATADGASLAPALALASTSFSAPDSAGEGSAITTANNNAFAAFNYYMVNSSTFLVLETDSTQVGSGIFELQNTPTSSSGVAHPSVSLVRPIARPHGALRRK